MIEVGSRPDLWGVQAVITGPVGSGKTHYAVELVTYYQARQRRPGLVVIARDSTQWAPLVGATLTLDREVVTRSLDWDRLLSERPSLLVVVEADPPDAWPHLDALGQALWRVGHRLLVLDEAQRWTPLHGGAVQLAKLGTDGRKRGLDWVVIAPIIRGAAEGVSEIWRREAQLLVAFGVHSEPQVALLEELAPPWTGQVGSLRLARRDETGQFWPGEYLVYDRRTRQAVRVDGRTGTLLTLSHGQRSESLG